MSDKVMISTIEELVNVATKENIERLFADLFLFTHFAIEAKEKSPEIVVKGMQWTDDGENKLTGVIFNP